MSGIKTNGSSSHRGPKKVVIFNAVVFSQKIVSSKKIDQRVFKIDFFFVFVSIRIWMVFVDRWMRKKRLKEMNRSKSWCCKRIRIAAAVVVIVVTVAAVVVASTTKKMPRSDKIQVVQVALNVLGPVGSILWSLHCCSSHSYYVDHKLMMIMSSL